MKISFCTTCAQRLYQLEQTWDSNIELIKEHADTEWAILNYDAGAELHKFIMDKIEKLPPNFLYAKENTKRFWHASVAKNMAHRLGSGNILFNLDCDNYIGNGIKNVKKRLRRNTNSKVLQDWSGVLGDGTFGRIAMSKDMFYKLGGYDESFWPMAHQDDDLIHRAIALGCALIRPMDPDTKAVKNTKEEGIKLCENPKMKWLDMLEENSKISKNNINQKKLQANNGNPTVLNAEIFRGGLYY